MKRFSVLIITISSLLLMSGCGVGLGHSADPPTDLKATAGDTSVTVTWTMTPGVEYWLLYAPASSISTENWASLPGARSVINAVSPQLISGLTNGQVYSFVMDARVDQGPAGASTASISATPRMAGANWSAGTSLGAMDLRGVAYGTVAAAVGANGAIFSSSDGMSWTARTNPSPAANLNAVRYGGNYLAAGAAGVVLLSSDAITWTQQASGTGSDLYALATNGAGQYVATGANGTIIASGNGSTWSTVTSGTTNNLYGVTYGNGRYVAVGANGTLLTSTDGVAWQSASSNTSANLNGVAYGATLATGAATVAATFVAAGAAGTIVTSPDGLTWTAQAPMTTNALTAIDFGRQFVTVASQGGILTSTDGATWLTQASGTANDLNAVGHDAYGYFAVGAAGTNLSSF